MMRVSNWKAGAWLLAALLLVTMPAAAGDFADAVHGASSISFAPKVQHAGATLTITGPEGFVFEQRVGAEGEPMLRLFDKAGNVLPDGQYAWQLTLAPVLSPEVRKALADARSAGDDAAVADLRKQGLLPTGPRAASGYFRILDGALVSDALVEGQGPGVAVKGIDGGGNKGIDGTGRKDQVFFDDLIVVGSICAGQDCSNGESFGFDTIRLKENNLRIKFQDTSTSASFPSRDWQLTANDSSNGGANKFSLDDIDGGRTPFTVEAGAPSHSLYVDDGGRIGFGTSTPVVELHVKDGDTPTLRLEQDGSSGFTAQTFDIAANEANFFIRDVTNGSKLVMKIKPGAPTSSIFVAADGNIGMNTEAPTGDLHVRDTAAGDNTEIVLQHTNSSAQWAIRANNSSGQFAIVDQDGAVTPFKIEKGAINNSFTIDAAGRVGINTNTPNAAAVLDVNGPIYQSGVVIHADYVFEPDYELKSIEEQAAYMWANKHLPSIPKRTAKADGTEFVEIGSHRRGIVEELEKAHIYIEQLHTQLRQHEEELAELRKLEERLAALENNQ